MMSESMRIDMRNCRTISQGSMYGFERACSFVLATIQQQLETVPTIMASFDEMGPESPYAFGSKAKGLDYVFTHKRSLFEGALERRKDPIELQRWLMQIPGLGLVKSGFLCQLFSGDVGCIDTHNLQMHDIKPSVVRSFPIATVKPVTATRRIGDYQSLCLQLGGSFSLWRNWCNHIATLRPDNWPHGGDSVSRFHVDCLDRTRAAAKRMQYATGLDFEPEFSRESGQ